DRNHEMGIGRSGRGEREGRDQDHIGGDDQTSHGSGNVRRGRRWTKALRVALECRQSVDVDALESVGSGKLFMTHRTVLLTKKRTLPQPLTEWLARSQYGGLRKLRLGHQVARLGAVGAEVIAEAGLH